MEEFLCGSLAACCACLISNPFDVIKIRIQLQAEALAQGKIDKILYRNVWHAGYVIYKKDGIRGLHRGLNLALVLHGFRNGVRLGWYQWCTNNGYTKDSNGNMDITKATLTSVTGGLISSFLGSPLYMVKVQFQAEGAGIGFQHHHKNALAAFRRIYKTGGIKGMWRGCTGTMISTAIGSPVQLVTFAKIKQFLKNELFAESALAASLISSIITSSVQTLVLNPFDLIVVRLYNQPFDAKGKGILYDGFTDCIRKIYRKEGILGFYQGVKANFMRIAPHGMLVLVFWDIFKSILVEQKTRRNKTD